LKIGRFGCGFWGAERGELMVNRVYLCGCRMAVGLVILVVEKSSLF
jgi:hypothetical protein